MTYRVQVLQRAQDDVDGILRWLVERSPAGAARWHEAFVSAAADLAVNPYRFGLASEHQALDRNVRERFFKTPRGRRYRIVFIVEQDQIRILRVRAPGQLPLELSDV